MAKQIRDNTALIPFVLFGILALIVGYAIYKGTKKSLPLAADYSPGSANPSLDPKFTDQEWELIKNLPD